MKISFDLNLRLVLRWVLGLIFIWAALSKIANPQDFYASTLAYRLPFPRELLALGAVILPWLELLCGLMLLSKVWSRAATAWAVILCLFFVVLTGQAWMRGLTISCGCMKLDFLDAHTQAVFESVAFACVRAVVFLGIAIFLCRESWGRRMRVHL